MRTITVNEAQLELPQVLDEVEAVGEVLIISGQKDVSRLVRVVDAPLPRARTGLIRGLPFHVPDAAFAPLSPEELKKWGL